jgi:hypothetical protein
VEPDATAGSWLLRLQDSTLAAAIREHAWCYPAAEVLHILSFIVALGFLLVLDLRLAGFGRMIGFDVVAGRLLPWAVAAIGLTVPTGIVLLLPDAAAIATNPAFLTKLVLMGLAAANAAFFHFGPWRTRQDWNLGRPPPAARIGGLVSILLWIGVVASGRLIAYV